MDSPLQAFEPLVCKLPSVALAEHYEAQPEQALADLPGQAGSLADAAEVAQQMCPAQGHQARIRPVLSWRRAGESATGYALRVFPRAINTASRTSTRRSKKQIKN